LSYESRLRILFKVFAMAGIATLAGPALAQGINVSGLCDFADGLKMIAGAVAVVAIIVLAINSFFSKSSVIGDIITTVIIGCVVVAGAAQLVSLTGLASC
jgi:hypothetical protein